MKVLVTGATGFIGTSLCAKLIRSGYDLIEVTRNQRRPYSDKHFRIKEISPKTEWLESLTEVDTIVHLASRVHVLNEKARNPLKEYRFTNVAGTQKLLNDAIKAKVKRLIFVSSIKVHGESTEPKSKGYNELCTPNPEDPYAVSKWEAEQILNKASDEGKIETIIIRPPLVYGPGVKANFLKLLTWIQKGLPLPLAHIDNKRSMVAMDNLVDIIIRCINHPNIVQETLNVSDGDDLSTTKLIRKIADHMNKKPKLYTVNSKLIKLAFKMFRKESIYERLWGSLVVDSSKCRDMFNWSPVVSASEGIERTVDWYMNGME